MRTKMYRCARLVKVPGKVELPVGMYKMEAYNTIANVDLAATYYTHAPVAQQNGPEEVSALELRQEAVLERLRTLKQQLDRLQSSKVTSTTTSAAPVLGAAAHSSPVKTAAVHDLVISANPSQPPYCLVLLRRLLGEAGCAVYASSHLHSSVPKVSERLHKAFTHHPLGDRSNHTLAFTLQWKDVHTPNLMVSPLRQSIVTGEANIVRYVSRLFPLTSPYNYEASGTFATIAETDHLMDHLGSQLAGGTAKERHAALGLLNERLSKTAFLMGESCGVVDILAWSLALQAGLDKATSANVTRWLNAVGSKVAADLGIQDQAAPAVDRSKPGKTRAEKPGKSQPSQAPSGKGKRPSQAQAPERRNHMTRTQLESYLKGLNIAYQVKEHAAAFTVDQLLQVVGELPGIVTKNLFLKDKKKNLYLLSARHNTQVNLSNVAKEIGAKDLRLAEESVLFETLGVKQGCVTALALVNDSAAHRVQFLMEAAALSPTSPYIGFHPLTNDATLSLSPVDLERFLESTGHQPKLISCN